LLAGAGVAGLAVAGTDPEPAARALRFEAGWLAAETGGNGDAGEAAAWRRIGAVEAVGAATWAVADAFGVGGLGVGRIVEGTRANFLVLDAPALEFALSLKANLQLVCDGSTVTPQPRQA
ncbi:hypothetical protein HK405_001905, partial [Cladochytrium tenue]